MSAAADLLRLRQAALHVINKWERGDLADAVRKLNALIPPHDDDCITLCPVPTNQKCRIGHGCWCTEDPDELEDED